MRLVEQPFDDFPDLLVLNFNGTMLDDLSFELGAMAVIFQAHGRRTPTKEQFRTEVGGRIMDFYWDHEIPKSTTIKDLRMIRRIYYRERLDQVRFRPDFAKTLERCRKRGIRLAVCSREIPAIFNPLIDREHLRDCFDADIRIGVSNSRVRELQVICERANVPCARAVYLGDIADDIRDARTAGLKSVGFAHATSWNTATRIEQAKPDRIAHDFKKLCALLET